MRQLNCPELKRLHNSVNYKLEAMTYTHTHTHTHTQWVSVTEASITGVYVTRVSRCVQTILGPFSDYSRTIHGPFSTILGPFSTHSRPFSKFIFDISMKLVLPSQTDTVARLGWCSHLKLESVQKSNSRSLAKTSSTKAGGNSSCMTGRILFCGNLSS